MARGADLERLEGIYRDRFDAFVRIAFALTRDEGAARDAVQETFARALRAREGFRGDAPLEAWLWRILVNVSHSTRDAAGREESVPGANEDAFGIEPLEPGADFGGWVAALPERQRLVVFLRYWADLDYRSIAIALGVEVGTVSATLNAAHTALRRSLEEVSPCAS